MCGERPDLREARERLGQSMENGLIDRPKRVLIVEDDPDTVKLVTAFLARDGHEVISARNGITGLRMAREEKPDLVVLDLMLPGLDGLEICRAIREHSTVPIIMLTAMVDEEDRLAGLEMGADDYVTKPFSPRELAARVRAVLRRSAPTGEPTEGVLTHGDVTVDVGRRVVTVGDATLDLTRTEFAILVHVLSNPNRVITRHNVINAVFGHDFEGFDRTVDRHVSNLRRKLRERSSGGDLIETVYGVGYRLNNA